MEHRSPIGLGGMLIGVGVVLLTGCLLVWADSSAFQAALARRLSALGPGAERPSQASIATATRREALESGLVGRIEIPRLALRAMVVEGVSGTDLRHGVGHVPGTAFPGERGTVGLAGHRDTYFRELGRIERGDRICLTTPDGTFAYEAESLLVVDPGRVDLLEPRGSPALTLVTCYPFHWIGPAPQRFVVLARSTEATADTGAVALQAVGRGRDEP